MTLPTTQIVANVTAAAASWLTVALAAAVVLASGALLRRVRGTTLTAPAAWCIAAALAIGLVEFALAWGHVPESSLTASLWRYSAAVGAYCPLMAVLGAKRPQDRGWQWVVASLWLVLLVPAGQALASGAGNRLELFPAWRLLLATMSAMVLLNYLPTRRTLAAIAFAAGQICLMAPYLMDAPIDRWPLLRATGLASILAAFPLASLCGRRTTTTLAKSPLEQDRERWLSFRDAWGAFWALRVMQRINQSAEHGVWPVRLRWDGFAPLADDQIVDDLPLAAAVEQSMDAVLRRFERLRPNVSLEEIERG
jgi:hypothetical protein